MTMTRRDLLKAVGAGAAVVGAGGARRVGAAPARPLRGAC